MELVFLRGLVMQRAVPRDEKGRSDFGMMAASPARVNAFLQYALERREEEIKKSQKEASTRQSTQKRQSVQETKRQSPHETKRQSNCVSLSFGESELHYCVQRIEAIMSTADGCDRLLEIVVRIYDPPPLSHHEMLHETSITPWNLRHTMNQPSVTLLTPYLPPHFVF